MVRGKTSTGVDRRMGGRRMRVRDGQRGEYGFVESFDSIEPEAQHTRR